MPKFVTATLSNNAEPCILRYTTSDNKRLNIKADPLEAEIVLHTYNNGEWLVIFNKPIRIIGNEVFCRCRSLTSVTIPDSVTEIRCRAFDLCFSLTSVTIPNSVTKIGDYAFMDCSSLTSITIPNSVTKIGSKVFLGCNSLTSFYGKFASVDNRCLIVDGVLNSFAPAGLTEYTIPDSVTSIGKYAFYACRSLTSIIIPNSVTNIGEGAFFGCWSLIGVTIPNSITEIGINVFAHCSSLRSIIIPNSVTNIGEGAFLSCRNLQTIICQPTTPPILGEWAFGRIPSSLTIIIPEGCEDAYMNSDWSEVL